MAKCNRIKQTTTEIDCVEFGCEGKGGRLANLESAFWPHPMLHTKLKLVNKIYYICNPDPTTEMGCFEEKIKISLCA